MKIDVKKVAKLANSEFRLRLRGKAAVFVDWANVYGWRNRLNKEIDPHQLYRYLKEYKQIQDIRFYSGLDKHPKSKQFLREIKKIGFTVVSKEVKYIPVSIDTSHFKHIAGEIKASLNTFKHLKTKDIEKYGKFKEEFLR